MITDVNITNLTITESTPDTTNTITTTTTTTSGVVTTDTSSSSSVSNKEETITTTTTSSTTEVDGEDNEDLLEVSDRQLAYVHKIIDLEPIVGADVIEIATVLGWRVIVKKGLYKVGDLVVYVEIDSLLPPWNYFISDRLDKCNFKIKTIKMRGQLSQGYCIPIKELLNHPHKQLKAVYHEEENIDSGVKEIHRVDREETVLKIEIGSNVTEFIGIKKIQDHHGGGGGGNNIFKRIKSNGMSPFPSFLVKSDQPRIQNLPHYMETYEDVEFEVTEKLEGSSITAYHNNGKTGICSRNYELKHTTETAESEIFTTLVGRLDILKRLEEAKINVALQGEIIGPKIQGNIYGLPETQYKVYDIYLIDSNRYATQPERVDIMNTIGLKWDDHGVPFLGVHKIGGKKLSDILDMANGFSQLKGSKPKVLREGIVFKSNTLRHDRVIHFKSISNQYLLKK
ncbi:hypothetical protein DFA_08407 [Cavenderia fasciculata]|uniref:RNA ligase domain-containing protein n=1 Tax=Cavenderia fasciculata TaxID=261658 RepID=F4Q603_CACFS|nr:uncharacterized protein DFA_08407 [Cavenderia fasciculata]EGG17412.1 hypothetical protein DFA_08407 [Cavenderia fasciculata]|eukprot:XP_004355896.1 hypothetical protein DFA_08407 [Cavenderia fasciculata]